MESKQKFIGQIMTSKSPARSAEDIDDTALSYAEVKALCAGDERIKEKMGLDVAVAKLKLLKANHLSQRYTLEYEILNEFPKDIAALEQSIEGYRADMETLKANTKPDKDEFSPMELEGTVYTEKKAAGSAILAACKAITSPDAVPIGRYRGFEMELSFSSLAKAYVISLKGRLTHRVYLGDDIYGNIQRIDNELGGFNELMGKEQQRLENVRVQLENAKAEAERPFPQEELARLGELNIALDLDKNENEIVDGEREEDAEEHVRKRKEWER